MYFAAAAIAAGTKQSEAQKSKFGENHVRIDGRILHLSPWLTEQQIQTLAHEFSERKAKTYVKLNSSLSPDFRVQLNVSLSERLSSCLIQKVKSPNYTRD